MRPNNSFKPRPLRCVACVRSLRSHASPHRSRSGLTQALDRSQNYNVGRHDPGVLGAAQPPDLFSLERRAALRRSPSFSRLFVGSRARLRPTRIWQWFAESHAGAHAPPCGSPRACVQSVFAGLRSRCLTCAFNNRLVRSNNSFKPTPFRCVACVRSLRSHASPHRSRRGLTQALALKKSWVLFAVFGDNRFPRGTA